MNSKCAATSLQSCLDILVRASACHAVHRRTQVPAVQQLNRQGQENMKRACWCVCTQASFHVCLHLSVMPLKYCDYTWVSRHTGAGTQPHTGILILTIDGVEVTQKKLHKPGNLNGRCILTLQMMSNPGSDCLLRNMLC